MAAIDREELVEDGLEPTVNNADDSSGDTVLNPDGRTILRFHNNGSSSATVTIASQKTTKKTGNGLVSRANISLTLAAGEVQYVGPLKQEFWNNSSGQIAISYGGAGAADVDVEALFVPRYLA